MIAAMLTHREIISRIIGSYSSLVIRAYCLGRFMILRQRFLDEIGQYMPKQGAVLDLGSGIGLFAMYFAHLHPHLSFSGFDLNEQRVELSRASAAKLNLDNVRFEVGRAEEYRSKSGSGCQVIYTLDLMHHMPPDAVPRLVDELHQTLEPGGRLIIKEVDTKPAFKRIFTHALDLLMDRKHPPHYRSSVDMRGLLTAAGFRVYQHAMLDILPYPHVLYICEKGSAVRPPARS